MADKEQEIDFSWALIPNSRPGEDVIPFLPRFLLQEIIFEHCPYDDLYPKQPRLRGNLLCKTDWLRLRRIAGTECAILPIREIAVDPRCSACEHPSSGERRTARQSLLASTLASERILLATGGKSATHSASEKQRRIRRRRCVIPASVLTSGAHLCSLSVPATPTHLWEFPDQIQLALSLTEIPDTDPRS